MTLTRRQATDNDVTFLLDVFLRAMRPHITIARGHWDEPAERVQFLEQLEIDHTEIIRHGGVDVGFLTAMECGHDIELHTLCIAPEHQGNGLGTAVVRQVLREARGGGYGLVLSVLKANTGARALYERLGFVVRDESPSHYRMRFVS
jgi:ribosomal protein S18 acetylase RimI-like enzyme